MAGTSKLVVGLLVGTLLGGASVAGATSLPRSADLGTDETAAAGPVTAKQIFRVAHVCINCDLRGVTLRGDVRDTDAQRSDLTGADFRGANLFGANFSHTIIRGVDFRMANLPNLEDSRADSTTRFDGAKTRDSFGQPIGLGALRWPGVRIDGMDFRRVSLTDSDFSGGSLRAIDLRGSSMARVSFHAADLTGAKLSRWDGYGAEIKQVDFSGANLTDATLDGAEVDGVVGLAGVNITGTIWSNTTCPDGSNSDDHGDTCAGH